MKEKIAIILGIILFIALCGLAYYYLFVHDFVYYTQIDNTKLERIDSNGGVIDVHGGMKYEYTLTMYDEDGKSKEIKLGTNRELREAAYLKVNYFFLRGVYKWEEIQYDDLPNKVKDHYKD
jgi:uncharacterized protein (TIGR01655 family)